MSQNSKKTDKNKFFTFDKIALVIGFIVDTITLISILFSIRNENFTLPQFINYWLAFSIWVLGFYLYLALLHSYWQKNLEKRAFQDSFWDFIFIDLILGFCNPFLSFLGLVSLITLAWIASFETGIATISILGLLFVIIAFLSKSMSALFGTEIDFSYSAKQEIDENWTFIKKRIKSKLPRKQWIGFWDLEEIAAVWHLDSKEMVYALAKYASENPTATTFGEVYQRKDKEKISGDFYVLINLKEVDLKKYYYTG